MTYGVCVTHISDDGYAQSESWVVPPELHAALKQFLLDNIGASDLTKMMPIAVVEEFNNRPEMLVL